MSYKKKGDVSNMKRVLSVMIVLAMVFQLVLCFPVISNAETTTTTIYATDNGRVISNQTNPNNADHYTTYGLTTAASKREGDKNWTAPTTYNGVSTTGTGSAGDVSTDAYNAVVKITVPENTDFSKATSVKFRLNVWIAHQLNEGTMYALYVEENNDWTMETITRSVFNATQSDPNYGEFITFSSPVGAMKNKLCEFDITDYMKKNVPVSDTETVITFRVAAPRGSVRFYSLQNATGDNKMYAPRIAIIEGEEVEEEFSTELEEKYMKLWEKRIEQITGGDYDLTDPVIQSKLASVDAGAKRLYDSMIKWDGTGTDTRKYLWEDKVLTAPSGANQHWSDLGDTFTNLGTMATAYMSKGSAYYKDKELANQIVWGLDRMMNLYYNPTTPGSNNWWYMRIGSPLAITNVMILMREEITGSNMKKYTDTISRFNPNFGDIKDAYGKTVIGVGGTNKAWAGQIIAYNAILAQDSEQLEYVKNGMKSLLKTVTKGEGYYSDGSYKFHGAIAYNGGYGCGMIEYLANLAGLFSGSEWEMKYEDGSEEFLEFIAFKAYEPFIYKASFMEMELGRAISRFSSTGRSDTLSGIKGLLLMLDTFDEESDLRLKSMIKKQFTDYPAMINSLPMYQYVQAKKLMADDTIPVRGELDGLYRFPSTDRVSFFRGSFAAGLAMNSTRMYTFEAINGEGLRAWYTGNGMLYVYTNDTEQFNDHFWATVDYHRLPGITVARNESKPEREGNSTYGTYSWVGGSDVLGQYGATGMHIKDKYDKTDAKKSWFFFDDEIVCLGAGIKNADSTNPVETTIESRKLKKDDSNLIYVNGEVDDNFNGEYENVKTVLIEGNVEDSDMGYYFPENQKIQMVRKEHQGAWTNMYNYYVDKLIDPTIRTNNFATMYFAHGVNPDNAKYSYVILPATDKETLDSYGENPDIEILENSTNIQAVRDNKLKVTAINFWNDNNTTQSIAGVTVNKKASVTVMETDETYIIGISDPTQLNTGKIHLEFDYPVTGAEADGNVSKFSLGETFSCDVAMAGKEGQTTNIVLYKTKVVIPEEPKDPDADIALYAAEDTYISDNSSLLNTNYGEDGIMQSATKGGHAANNRMPYIKFTLPEYFDSTKTEGAKLKLKISSINISEINTDEELVLYSAVTDWQENTLTWNNADKDNITKITSITVSKNTTASNTIEFDISEYLKDKKAGDTIAFTIKPVNSWVIQFYTKEAGEIDAPKILLPNMVKTVFRIENASVTKADGGYNLSYTAKNTTGETRNSVLILTDGTTTVTAPLSVEDGKDGNGTLFVETDKSITKAFIWKSLQVMEPVTNVKVI